MKRRGGWIDGDLKVAQGGTLIARGVRVDGDIQGVSA